MLFLNWFTKRNGQEQILNLKYKFLCTSLKFILFWDRTPSEKQISHFLSFMVPGFYTGLSIHSCIYDMEVEARSRIIGQLGE